MGFRFGWIGRVGAIVALLCAGSLFGGCTSLLAKVGDPDMSILKRGAPRDRIDSEMGNPDDFIELEEGRYIAVYDIKLGAPKNGNAVGESATNFGKGLGASIAAGLLEKSVSAIGNSNAAPAAAAAVLVGLTIWGVNELSGTLRELTRISHRKKHRLEIVYDDRHRMLTHEVVLLERQ